MKNTTPPREFMSFEEFWPFYVSQHKSKTTRTLHFWGTTFAMLCVAGALFTKRRSLLLLAPIVGYGPAWIGHFFIEKNRPATFKHPIYSLRADFVMWTKIVNGTMDEEVARILRDLGDESSKVANDVEEVASTLN